MPNYSESIRYYSESIRFYAKRSDELGERINKQLEFLKRYRRKYAHATGIHGRARLRQIHMSEQTLRELRHEHAANMVKMLEMERQRAAIDVIGRGVWVFRQHDLSSRAEQRLERFSRWFPRKYRDELIGDILEDCHELREQGASEKKINRHANWQLFLALLAQMGSCCRRLGYAVAGWIIGRFTGG